MVVESYEHQALNRSAAALQQGALEPLGTQQTPLQGQSSNLFELRELTTDLPRHLRMAGPKPNPFLPWDPRLEVSPVGNAHALILNKYPVQRGHMLLVTRQWAAQGDWLNQADWHALRDVDAVTTGLWFFNSGPAAGASQPHRHIQLLPRHPGEKACPREPWFLERLQGNVIPSHHHAFAVEAATAVRARDPDQQDQAAHLESIYVSLCQDLALGNQATDQRPNAPYTLLLTRRWMALVRRRQDGVHGFSINALGFAGYLLATKDSDRDWLKSHGPDQLLAGVVA